MFIYFPVLHFPRLTAGVGCIRETGLYFKPDWDSAADLADHAIYLYFIIIHFILPFKYAGIKGSRLAWV